MKTAEDWFSELETYNQVNEQPLIQLSPIALKSTIKQIQLDAWKQGVSDSQEKTNDLFDGFKLTKVTPYLAAVTLQKQIVIAGMEKLKQEKTI